MAKAHELATVRKAVAAHQPGRSYRLANQNRMNNQFSEITERIHSFISGSHADFGALARDLFALLDFEVKLTPPPPRILDLKQRQKVIIFGTFSGRVGDPEKYFWTRVFSLSVTHPMFPLGL